MMQNGNSQNVTEPDFQKKIFFGQIWAQNSPKWPEIWVFWTFLEILSFVFSDFMHNDAKWQCPKCDRARFSKKKFFPAENAGNMPEKPVFGHFLEISSLVFFWFFAQKMRVSNAQNMAESHFWEKFFSVRKYRKYAGNRRFCRFSLDFILLFRCFFTQKYY